MKYFIIAGEASGDLHGSNLVKALKAKDPDAVISAWGGDLMSAAGARITKHISELAFMGFKEVLLNLSSIYRNFKVCKEQIKKFNPDTVIFIDYPGFNLRLAKWVKKQGYKTIYYISPQLWAWKAGRVNIIKKYIDKMIVILPFEKEFYAKYGYEVSYVGHPLLDAITGSEKRSDGEKDAVIALLPGSRKQEVAKMLPVMLDIAKKFSCHRFVIAGAPSLSKEYYSTFLSHENIGIEFNNTYEVLSHAKAAIVTSGTATLETALFGVPEVVCYKGSKFSYTIGRMLVKVPFISLVNLIMGKEVVKELIQDDFNIQSLENELNRLLHDKDYIDTMKEEFVELKFKLGGQDASERAAGIIYNYIKGIDLDPKK